MAVSTTSSSTMVMGSAARGLDKGIGMLGVLNCKLPSTTTAEFTMAKGQQKTNKEAKKPKKDTSPPKPLSSGTGEPVRATVTTAVIPRGKLKNK